MMNTFEWSSWHTGTGHIVAGIHCVLYWTNVGSIPLATVGVSIRYVFNIEYVKWTIVYYARSSYYKIKWNLFIDQNLLSAEHGAQNKLIYIIIRAQENRES